MCNTDLHNLKGPRAVDVDAFEVERAVLMLEAGQGAAKSGCGPSWFCRVALPRP